MNRLKNISNVCMAATLAVCLHCCTFTPLNDPLTTTGMSRAAFHCSGGFESFDSINVVATRQVKEIHLQTHLYPAAGILDTAIHIPIGDYLIVSHCFADSSYTEVDDGKFLKLNPLKYENVEREYGREFVHTSENRLLLPPAQALNMGLQTHTFTECDTLETVQLDMKDFSAELEFILHIHTYEGIVLDSIAGCIAGVPSKVQAGTGYPDLETLGQTYFKFNIPATSEHNLYIVKGSVRTLGLFPSDYGNSMTGKGILTIAVSITYGQQQRTFICAINLKEIIESSAIMQPMPDCVNFKIWGNRFTIDITDEIIIDSKLVESGRGDSMKGWVITGQQIQDVEL